MIKLGSLNLAVKDLDRSVAFYANLFSFPELSNYRSEHFRILDANGVLIGFNDSVSSADYGGPESGGVVLSFDAPARDDLDRLCASALALGATLKKPPHDAPYGAVEAMFTDPEGRAFRILAWTQPPK